MASLKVGDAIGFIGGGQLARMMSVAAARLGFRSIILEPAQNCPAGDIAWHHIIAPYDDKKALDELAKMCHVITYEFENVPASALDRLKEKTILQPHPKALHIAQDRYFEKQFLNALGIETAPWRLIDTSQSLLEGLKELGGDAILKTRRFGYDGKGQVRLKQTEKIDDEEILKMISYAPAILEGLVPFTKEISVIGARDSHGKTVFYDSPENRHQNGILHSSHVPANLSQKTITQAQAYTQKVLEAFDYIGVIGVEFFVMEDGSVIANEFAPRVHNSGHWTEAACLISQFENHVRAVAGLPLGEPHRHSNCIMENLIGDDVFKWETLLNEPQTLIHIYGKDESRPNRKMGHITRLIK
ncbi:5-(carboxyamino)imidazole ribonucleotide synthase [Bartonella tamiae]|uniref:N5-carboxyaminoimidazole ribonucleotide synthase n=1 Tax=Bartonella tamiae Th239 TaxID=1094558 RepID=J1K2P3_9HYPH|nr:5-(carboxyamino)imidazole ribonucleotide synthase [Bartonella tamiae]EJF91757.1 phosphoribosylaminoimidazole carboxylase, ATPase subunit [Bartonella tamiae Th239]EJF92575.1 phosphoribosylaminoimidazole carboxylase, ATPase subunit [Bartonella tamiae Th307]